jgi:hypothetical protein
LDEAAVFRCQLAILHCIVIELDLGNGHERDGAALRVLFSLPGGQ